ncbi:MAG: RNA polymerase sigma-54 factor, partial [Bacteroidetes bacterium SW_10_40_5]
MLKQGLNQKLLQKLSPQQIQFIQLLQLNSSEFEQRLEEELEENPALEDGTTAEETEENQEFEQQEENESPTEEGEIEEFDIADYLPSDEGGMDDYMPNDPNEEEKEVPMVNRLSLLENLEQQLGATELSEREENLARHLIGTIEEDGYLRRPLKSIAYDLAFLHNIRTNEEELHQVMKIIQSFDPPGVGARDLRECMLIQLERKQEQDDNVELAKQVVSNYMKHLANKHYERLMKALKIDREQLKEVLEVITHLNPKPGEGSQNLKAEYINPDFIVTNLSGELQVSLNSKNAPSLKISPSYQETLQGFKETKKRDKKLNEQVQFIK